jgi:N-acetylmuramoyl-L-alanine amidase
MLKKITLILTLLCMLVLTATGSNRRFTLVIDPGHGGHDVGAGVEVVLTNDKTL